MLPRESQVDLLRACLLTGDEARGAFARWQGSAADARHALGDTVAGGRLLAALLYRAALAGTWDVAAGLRTQLRVANDHEQRRSEAYRSVLKEAQAALAA